MLTRLRNGDEEASYNVARAFHQLGLYHLAIPYYEKVLQSNNENSSSKSLVREAAYNLTLIYRASESYSLVREIVRKYLTI
jgi:general transcription factor 3C polypeptide 3 (transcription factor C subunit 4)